MPPPSKKTLKRLRRLAVEAKNRVKARPAAKALRRILSPNGTIFEPGALGLGRGLPSQMHELAVLQELNPEEQIPRGLLGGSRKRGRTRRASHTRTHTHT